MADSYPTWGSGEDITADKLNAMIPKVVRKTADESRINTTTPTADAELFFTLEANATYVFDGMIKYIADPAVDIAFDFTVPSGCLGEYGVLAPGSGTSGVSATTGYSIRTESNDVAQARTYYGVTNAAMCAPIQGIIRNGGTAGNHTFVWNPNASSATETVVYTDSWFRYQRIG